MGKNKVIETTIGALIPDDKNFNKGTEYGKHLMDKSFSQFGAGRSVLIDKNNRIIAGNKSTEQFGENGGEKVIVVETTGDTLVAVKRTDIDLDSKEGREMALADNATAKANLDFDMDVVCDVCADLGIDAQDWGVNIENVTDDSGSAVPAAEIKEDDFDAEKDCIKVRCKEGDIWQLGEHRLMCGDSIDLEQVKKLVGGVKIDLVFTDPPYGMKKECDGVANDNLNYDDLLEFNKKWIAISFQMLKDNGSWYCWGIDEPLMDIYSNILKPKIKKREITFCNYLTWFKGCGQGQNSDYARSYARATEKCLFVMMGQQEYGRDITTWFDGFEVFRKLWIDECNKCGITAKKAVDVCENTAVAHYASRSQYQFPTRDMWNKMRDYAKGEAFKQEYDAIKQEYDAIKQEYDAIKQEWYKTRAYFDNLHDNMNDVWDYETNKFGRVRNEFLNEAKDCGGHATPKPLALCARGIKSSSREGEIVLDLFGGSGSTLIACEQTNRRCYMNELTPHYCDVILARWEKLTGKEAVLIENIKTS